MEFEGRRKSKCNYALIMYKHRNKKPGGWKSSWPWHYFQRVFRRIRSEMTQRQWALGLFSCLKAPAVQGQNDSKFSRGKRSQLCQLLHLAPWGIIQRESTRLSDWCLIKLEVRHEHRNPFPLWCASQARPKCLIKNPKRRKSLLVKQVLQSQPAGFWWFQNWGGCAG